MASKLLITGTGLLTLALARVALRDWGATKAECAATLPGDELVPDPAVTVTRGVTVEAPAERVWPWLVQRGWLGLPDGVALTVARVDPGSAIVLWERPWKAVWSFHVRPLGSASCRLLSHTRAPRPHGLARLGAETFEPVTLLMTRKMLLGIKQRAEATS